MEMKTINFTRKFSEDAYTELCNVLQSDRFVAIIDLTWGGWIKVHYYFIRALNFIFVPEKIFCLLRPFRPKEND